MRCYTRKSPDMPNTTTESLTAPYGSFWFIYNYIIQLNLTNENCYDINSSSPPHLWQDREEVQKLHLDPSSFLERDFTEIQNGPKLAKIYMSSHYNPTKTCT